MRQMIWTLILGVSLGIGSLGFGASQARAQSYDDPCPPPPIEVDPPINYYVYPAPTYYVAPVRTYSYVAPVRFYTPPVTVYRPYPVRVPAGGATIIRNYNGSGRTVVIDRFGRR